MTEGLFTSLGDAPAECAEEERLRELQKLEALGRLAAGVAHDFRNLIMVVQAGLRLIGTKLREGAPAADVDALIHEIMQRTQNAQALTGHLLAFSRNQVLAPKIVNVNERITSIASIFGQTLGRGISIRTILNEDVGVVEVDADQLDVALLNLAVNGRDAMNGCGTLTIETSGTADGSEPEDQPGFIRVTVKDTGIGMDAETKARAFEPFFTRKGDGKGTGLGLSQVYGFVVQSGGQVRIDSELGTGTQVHLYLPRCTRGHDADRSVTV